MKNSKKTQTNDVKDCKCNQINDCKCNQVKSLKKTNNSVKNNSKNIGFEDETKSEQSFELDENDDHSFELR